MTSSKVLMVKPLSFCSNPETIGSNSFQKGPEAVTQLEIVFRAQTEFEQFQNVLIDHGIEILKFEERRVDQTPDALFPNNWFFQLPDTRLFISAMFAPNRRREIRQDIIEKLGGNVIFDYSCFTERNLFLEGTGSIVFDHGQKLAYGCLSARTSSELMNDFADRSGYKSILFHAFDSKGLEIYHTNVMMAMGERNVVINLNSITNIQEREKVISTIKSSGKSIIDISHEQTSNFAGNMLFLKNKNNEKFWACSSRAYDAFTPTQRTQLQTEAKILHADLTTIEDYGGGGARCLMAQVWS
jgi:hypothetical protein